MSSFTEQQIRSIARDELRKILDAGLLYTAECKPNLAEKQGATPSFLKGTIEQAPATSPPINMPEAVNHLTDAETVNGYTLLKPKHYLLPKDFGVVMDWVNQQHGEYVKATNDTPGHWRIKA